MTLDFRGQRPPQLVVGEAHNILVVTESQFADGGRYIYLWPEATRLSKSHVLTKIGTMVTKVMTIRPNCAKSQSLSD